MIIAIVAIAACVTCSIAFAFAFAMGCQVRNAKAREARELADFNAWAETVKETWRS